MELIDWITLAIFFIAGAVVGWRWSASFHLALFRKILSELGVSNQQLLKIAKSAAAQLGIEEVKKIEAIEERVTGGLDEIEIKVEKHGEMLYAFRSDNDQFIGQGSTRDDLIAAMKSRMNNVRLTVVEGGEYIKEAA